MKNLYLLCCCLLFVACFAREAHSLPIPEPELRAWKYPSHEESGVAINTKLYVVLEKTGYESGKIFLQEKGGSQFIKGETTVKELGRKHFLYIFTPQEKLQASSVYTYGVEERYLRWEFSTGLDSLSGSLGNDVKFSLSSSAYGDERSWDTITTKGVLGAGQKLLFVYRESSSGPEVVEKKKVLLVHAYPLGGKDEQNEILTQRNSLKESCYIVRLVDVTGTILKTSHLCSPIESNEQPRFLLTGCGCQQQTLPTSFFPLGLFVLVFLWRKKQTV